MDTDLSLDLNDGGGGGVDLNDLLNAPIQPPPPAGGAPPDAEATRKANELLAQQLADQQRRNEELEARLATRRYDTEIETPPPPQTQVPHPPLDLKQIQRNFAEAELREPGSGFTNVFAAAMQAANDLIDKRLGPVASGAASTDVDAYAREQFADDPDTLAEFKGALTPQIISAMGGLTPQQRRQQLDWLADAAFGRAQRKAKSGNLRDRKPPPYSGGQSVAGGEAIVAPPADGRLMFNGKPLNNTQRELYETVRDMPVYQTEAGRKRLAAMLKDAAGDA